MPSTRQIEDEHILNAFSLFGFIFLSFLIFGTVAVLMLERAADRLIIKYRHDIETAIETGEDTLRNLDTELSTELSFVSLWKENDNKNLSDIAPLVNGL